MPDGPVDPGWLRRTASEAGYIVVEFERAYRLAHLLREVEAMSERSDDEIRYGLELEGGRHEPGLLFGDIPVAQDIAQHPAALWRSMHPHGKRDGEEAAEE